MAFFCIATLFGGVACIWYLCVGVVLCKCILIVQKNLLIYHVVFLSLIISSCQISISGCPANGQLCSVTLSWVYEVVTMCLDVVVKHIAIFDICALVLSCANASWLSQRISCSIMLSSCHWLFHLVNELIGIMLVSCQSYTAYPHK